MSVRLGRGDGTFDFVRSYSSEPTSSFGVALGDLNGDGVLDLVTGGMDGSSGTGNSTVRLGVGDGTFGAQVSYAMNDNIVRAIALADFNGDGALDMVASGAALSGGSASVRLGQGDGTFGAAVSYQSEITSSMSVFTGDLNNDGHLDFVTSGGSAGGYATIRLGLGNGAFQAALSYAAEASGSTSVALADLNGDNVLDLVTAGSDTTNGRATVRIGLGDGTFGAAVSYLTTGANTAQMLLADMNGDDFLDLVTFGTTTAPSTVRAAIQLGRGDGTFAAAQSYLTYTGVSLYNSGTVADLNHDGVLDAVTSVSGGGGITAVRLGSTESGIGPLLPFSLRSLSDARQAIGVFAHAQDNLLRSRSAIGAFQSRLGVAVATVTTSAENFTAAESQLRDADIADESAQLVRLRILQQAGMAILSQSNSQPRLALTLLSG